MKNTRYLKYRRRPIQENTILLEAGQGKNINGNMFHLAKAITETFPQFQLAFVTTPDTRQKAPDLFRYYHMENIQFVDRLSKNYLKLLGTARFLMTDNSFPPFFLKRDEQICLNTWHGTPLKVLGKKDFRHAASYANIQKNYATADYALFPNPYTRDIFMNDYDLANIISTKIVMTDYPRNRAFYDESLKKTIIANYHLENKQVIAYMPTWRGSNREASVNRQKETILTFLKAIDQKLKPHQELYLNLHFLVGNTLDLSPFQHIHFFPEEYETYDFLNVCDTLITDYSSVFFDFAITGRKILLFCYDREEYEQGRGTYFPIDNLPFPIATTVDDLIKNLNEPLIPYPKFQETFCPYASKDCAEQLLKIVLEQKGEACESNGKPNHFFIVSNITTMNQAAYVSHYLKSDGNAILCLAGKRNKAVYELVEHLPADVQLFMPVHYNFITFFEKILTAISLRSRTLSRLFKSKLEQIYAREAKRKFYHLKIDVIHDLYNPACYLTRETASINAPLIYYEPGKIYTGLKQNNKLRRDNERFKKQHAIKVIPTENIYAEGYEPFAYNLCFRFIRLFSSLKKNTDLELSMTFIAQKNDPLDFRDVSLMLGEDINIPATFQVLLHIRSFQLVKMKATLKSEVLSKAGIQNKLYLYRAEPRPFRVKITYSISGKFLKNRRHHASDPVPFNEKSACFLRQSKGNDCFLTVRPILYTDTKKEKRKINLAYYLAKGPFYRQAILLYEKDAARYEESASVVFERLMRENQNHIYYILDPHHPRFQELTQKYHKHIVAKYSLKHYLLFFAAKTLIGTEAPIHALELRNNNPHVTARINDPKLNTIFLQHGVMYMISLDSASRTFFKPRPVTQKGKYRVVVSSNLEARHFIHYGHYDESQLIICGLPKFDRSYQKTNARKIVIMPTWRPWEYNEASVDFRVTKYYQMLVRIAAAIPEKYQDEIIILPHPLFKQAAYDDDFPLKDRMDFTTEYDHILRETRLLITDYSSIAYDAFYRGCQVAFYWEELEECLEHYGENTKLMIKEENNIFAPVFYNPEDLHDGFANLYENPVAPWQKEIYKKIVQFDDGKNTERLIQALRREELIPS